MNNYKTCCQRNRERLEKQAGNLYQFECGKEKEKKNTVKTIKKDCNNKPETNIENYLV